MDTDITFQLRINEDHFEANIPHEFATEHEAQALADTMPKWLRARVIATGHSNGDGSYRLTYEVTSWASFTVTRDNARNEAGIKRLYRLLASYPVEYTNVGRYRGYYATLDEALAAVGAA